MTADIVFDKDKTLYCLLVGTSFTSRIDRSHSKRWWLKLFRTEQGRKQGMLYQARHYPGSDLLTFELKLEDLIKIAELQTVIPRELHVDKDIALFLREKARGQ